MSNLLEVYVVTHQAVDDMINKAEAGDDNARLGMIGITNFLQTQQNLRRGMGKQCFWCEYEFNRRSEQPGAFVVMVPSFVGENWEQVPVTGICRECTRDHWNTLDDDVSNRLREWGISL